MAVYEWWFYHAPFTIKDLVNTMFITVGTAGLYKCEKKSKEKEALFIVPITDSLQENLHSIIKDYKDKKISRYYYLSWMYEFEKLLYLIPKIIKKTNIDTIKIKENEILFETKAPKIVIEDDGSFRSPTFEMLNFGEYEPKIAALLFSILQDGDTILDIGAGIGWYSLNFSKNFPTSSIYAFEPIKELFQILEKNIKTNNATNVRIFNFGIDNSKRINKFYYLRNQHEYLKNIFHPMELDCRVRSLSEVVDFLDLKKLDFIKQDFKFKENAFLTSNENSIIDKFKPLIMFSLGQYCDEEFIKTFQKDLQLLENLGYEKLIIGEDLNHNVKKDRHYLLFHSEKHKNIIYKNI
jgi:FkbM family methyltransferase